MKQQDSIIVLHYTRCSDSAVMLHSLSQHWGRKSFLVRSASRHINYFQPLNILDCDLATSSKSSIMTASSFSEHAVLASLRSSYSKNAISMFLAELLFKTLADDSADEGLFEWCRGEILLLDGMEKDFPNFHLRFLLDYCTILGFAPDASSLLPFTERHNARVVSLMDRPFERAMLIPMSGDDRTEICARLLKYLAFHLERSVNVRSLDVLSELF